MGVGLGGSFLSGIVNPKFSKCELNATLMRYIKANMK